MNKEKDNKHKQNEELMVQEEFDKLLEYYKNSKHRQKCEIINKAFSFANQAHKGVERQSGEPYITHPLAVAMIVCEEMGLGSTSICSALLHDVVEDTDYTVEDLRNIFGDKIAEIVDGLTKIAGGIFAEAASQQAENMRKLLLTMSSDIRVILIKIADRLHNMRTLGSLLPAKQYKIAGETMFLYAPLAHRLGLFSIKSELEDLSFKYEHPEEHKQISHKIQLTESDRAEIYNHFETPIRARLDAMGIKCDMKSRVKTPYSIWNKMKSKNVDFEDIYDIFAVRIIFKSEPDVDEKKRCWDIYSAITDVYKLRPDRIRDWVSHPKANGYQALHLTVMGPDGQWIEVQVRSSKMDEIAERGLAAHWKYKENIDEESALDKWLGTIQEILENPNPNAMDFLDTIKLNLFTAEIFVFTPKGDIRTLPQNATALDFAYDLHTNIGNRCIGAKVNHRLVPLSQKLSSGDQVEILTSKSRSPMKDWLSFVTTAKARTKIEVSLRKQRREQAKEGEEMLIEMLRKAGIEPHLSVLDRFAAYFDFPRKEDMYYAIAEKQITLPENLRKILKEKSENVFFRYAKQMMNVVSKPNEEEFLEEDKSLDIKKIDRKKTYILQEESYKENFTVADCCKPIPGDEVFGFINDDGRLIIHKRTCDIGTKLKANFGDRILSCEWAGHKTFSFPSTIEIKGLDRLGMLNEITQAISTDFSVNIHKLMIESNAGMFYGKFEISVHDVDDINQLCHQIQRIKGVKQVNRVE